MIGIDTNVLVSHVSEGKGRLFGLPGGINQSIRRL